jgi:homoserine kinase
VPDHPRGALLASVVVPATSANLGCAFDCAALAVSLYLRVSAEAVPAGNHGLEVAYRGPNAGEVPLGEDNFIIKAIRLFAAGRGLPAARIVIENEIPLGVGLGSSAAAIVAGILLGAELSAVKIDSSEALLLALDLEGHPDNIAAAMHGGMVVSAVADDPRSVLVSKAEVSQELDFVAVIPGVPLPTEKARAVLPREYSHQDVVANLQRTALLAAAFFSGKDLSPEMFRDRLHQPYRAPLVPGIAGCLQYRHEDLAGIYLSGAGSAVMGVVRHSPAQDGTKNAKKIGDDLVAEFARNGVAASAHFLKADNRGARVIRG